MNDPLLPQLRLLAERQLPALLSDPQALRGDGSDRQIYRFCGVQGRSWVGVTNPAVDENRAFLAMSRHFRQQGLPVPKIYAEDLTQQTYLLEDLGDENLADWLACLNPELPAEADQILKAYREALNILVDLQTRGTEGFDRGWCHAAPESNMVLYQTDLEYFRDRFWRVFVPQSPDRPELQQEFSALAAMVGQLPRTVFVSRDFQSRNLMWHQGRLYVIDYQSGGIGAPHYDLAALLYASKARLNDFLRAELVTEYLQLAAPHGLVDSVTFPGELEQFVLLRRLRSLGTYGYLSVIKSKWYFLEAIPSTILEVRQLLSERKALQRWAGLRRLFEQWCTFPELHDPAWLLQRARSLAAQRSSEEDA